MKIRIDVTSLGTPRLTGVGIYVKYLTLALDARADCDVRPVFYAERWNHRRFIRNHLGVSPAPYIRGLSGLNLGKADVFHAPDFHLPQSAFVAKVATIHDMVDHHPEFVGNQTAVEGQKKFQRRIFEYKPSAVIVPTTFIRDEVIARAPSIGDRLFVVPHGVDHRPIPAKKPASPFPFPYFLFVSTLDKRKNAIGAVYAFAKFAETHQNVRLVLIGMNGSAASELQRRIASSAVRERIIVPGFVNADVLTAAYMNAAGLFFPSFYEGFGFPILEAMRLGCPVVTSRMGAMLELAGDAALLTDPNDQSHMAEGLRFLIEDQGLRADLVSRGKQRSAEFTWARCAEQTVEVYRRAIANRSGKPTKG